ncbi:MAG: DNA-binding protein [Segetibacter sp.]|nr:DNA-binding protein [Segetibacter sp.]
MAKANANIVSIMPDEVIISKIYLIRGQKVMLDEDLAELYQVETKRLNEQVKRNIDRFPKDFMFQLSEKEFANLKSQFATSSWGGRRKPPFVFTEQGVSMLSGVLNSPIAVQVHIQIIRIFTKMRELLLTNKDILLKLEKLENDVKENKDDIAMIFKALKQLLNPPQQKRRMIGFKRHEEEDER